METAQAQKDAVLKFRQNFRRNPTLVPVHKLQEHAARPRPFKRPIWVSSVGVPALEACDDGELRARLWEVFEERADGTEKLDYPVASVPFHGEWVGCKKKVDREKPVLSELDRFNGMQKDCDKSTTIFYLSGSGWMRVGPPGSRPLIQQLSQHSGSRVFTIQTRLAPKYTLPTVILDALVGYLYLIAPPKGAMHDPIDPSTLILAGESGGATLHLAILQFLQHLIQKAARDGITNPTLQANGRLVPLRMPRGCAFVSPPCDLTSALPAAQAHEHIDWMPERGPWFRDDFPADALWPAHPPRAEIYVDASAMRHPLIQPSSWRDWRGMPPMWIACGHERYCDGIRYFVKNLAESGVRVQFYEYEFMVHSFAVVMPFMPQAKHCMKLWGTACREMGMGSEEKASSAKLVQLGELKMREMPVESLFQLSESEVQRRMKARIDKLKGWVWRGPTKGDKSKI